MDGVSSIMLECGVCVYSAQRCWASFAQCQLGWNGKVRISMGNSKVLKKAGRTKPETSTKKTIDQTQCGDDIPAPHLDFLKVFVSPCAHASPQKGSNAHRMFMTQAIGWGLGKLRPDLEDIPAAQPDPNTDVTSSRGFKSPPFRNSVLF